MRNCFFIVVLGKDLWGLAVRIVLSVGDETKFSEQPTSVFISGYAVSVIVSLLNTVFYDTENTFQILTF